MLVKIDNDFNYDVYFFFIIGLQVYYRIRSQQSISCLDIKLRLYIIVIFLWAGICLSERDQDRYILSCNELRTIYYQPLRLYLLLSSYQCQNLKCLLLAIVFCFAVIISCAYFVRRGHLFTKIAEIVSRFFGGGWVFFITR
jgi:hypothetical protein